MRSSRARGRRPSCSSSPRATARRRSARSQPGSLRRRSRGGTSMKRRSFLQGSGALGLLGLTACANPGASAPPSKARVLVVGGGYGGATAAKYVRLLSDYKIDVVMVEPGERFISCPLSNLVLGGSKTIADLSISYDKLGQRHGVTVVRDTV